MMTSKFFAALLAAAVLAGCVSPVAAPTPERMDYSRAGAVQVNVAKVEFHNEYNPQPGGNNIEYTFKVTPAAAARQLVEEKLVAGGFEKILRVTVEDASVLREVLPESEKGLLEKGIFGAFATGPAEQLTGRVALRFEMVAENAPDIILGRASLVADRQTTVAGNASLAAREQAYHNLTQAMMNDIATGLGNVVQATFNRP